MMPKVLSLLLFLAVVAGCQDNSEKIVKTVNLNNGLAFEFPYEQYDEVIKEQIVKYNLAKPGSRSPEYISINLIEGEPKTKLSESRIISGREYLFSTSEYEGGSGGGEYELTVWKPLSEKKGVVIKYFVQSESKPSFDRIWQIAESTRLNE